MTITLLCGLADEAKIFLGTPGLQVLCGSAARDRLAGLIASDCAALVSAGVAGALAPNLTVGSLCVGGSVVLADRTALSPDLTWATAIRAATGASARIVFSDPRELCATANQRAALRAATGADIVDEESFAVARLAARLGVPFAVIRTISDTADEDLPAAEQDATNPDGSPDLSALIGDLFRDPGEIPGMARSGEEFERALSSLRDAFGRLGPTLGFAP